MRQSAWTKLLDLAAQISPDLARLLNALQKLPECDRQGKLAAIMKAGLPMAPGNRKDFASDFAASFDRLDRQAGNRNGVSLVDLRQALPAYDRTAFDAGLAELRRS